MKVPVLVLALWASTVAGLVIAITYDEAAGVVCGLATFVVALAVFPSGRQALLWVLNKLLRLS